MIDYAKVILPKVSFSEELFRKELVKCINWIGTEELDELKQWCYQNFGAMYPKILDDAFAHIAA